MGKLRDARNTVNEVNNRVVSNFQPEPDNPMSVYGPLAEAWGLDPEELRDETHRSVEEGLPLVYRSGIDRALAITFIAGLCQGIAVAGAEEWKDVGEPDESHPNESSDQEGGA